MYSPSTSPRCTGTSSTWYGSRSSRWFTSSANTHGFGYASGPSRRPRPGRGTRSPDLEHVLESRVGPHAHHGVRGVGVLHSGVRGVAVVRTGATDDERDQVRDRGA